MKSVPCGIGDSIKLQTWKWSFLAALFETPNNRLENKPIETIDGGFRVKEPEITLGLRNLDSRNPLKELIGYMFNYKRKKPQKSSNVLIEITDAAIETLLEQRHFKVGGKIRSSRSNFLRPGHSKLQVATCNRYPL